MAIPDRIPVSREGGNYSSCMGIYSLDDEDNQFWGQVVASFSTSPKPTPPDWESYKRWYAVLHKFDGWGRHIATDHWFASPARLPGHTCSSVCKKSAAPLECYMPRSGDLPTTGNPNSSRE